MATTHLIEEYKVKDNTILCVCGWFGSADDFAAHQFMSPPTDKKPSPDKYEDVPLPVKPVYVKKKKKSYHSEYTW